VNATDREHFLAVVREAGPLDVFVFNAGIPVTGDPLALDPEDVNIRAAYHASIKAA